MAKITWPGATLLAPLPVVLVTCGTMEKPNAATVAWTGIVNSEPPMTYISLRPSRHSHKIIFEESALVSFEVPDANTILVKSYDKQVCGQIAAEIRSKRPPEPYHGKGVKYEGEHIRRKAGKTGK